MLRSEQRHCWGNYPPTQQQEVYQLWWPNDPLPHGKTILPKGNARSYGDSCRNHAGIVVSTKQLDRFIEYDKTRGIIRCGSGVLLKELLELVVPDRWFLPVVPGTQLITVGGAIANDIHGKNNHRNGTFGNHILDFGLRRDEGDALVCSEDKNPELFAATIGGLGLTGLITWATIQLKPIPSPWLKVETIPFNTLEEVLELLQSSQKTHEYNVAWVDCLNQPANNLRGIFSRGNFCDMKKKLPSNSMIKMPFYLPSWALNPFTMKNFNRIIYHKNNRPKKNYQHYNQFLFPLDKIDHWNKMYGKKGFVQFQGLIPQENAEKIFKEMFHIIIQSQQGSFLSVLKSFGEHLSKGLLSFPKPGFTLALDFPYRGHKTIDLMHQLYRMTLDIGGRIYPAKDSCLTPKMFQQSFPELEKFLPFVDSQFTSDFWQRVT